jgi:hypothetical protein
VRQLQCQLSFSASKKVQKLVCLQSSSPGPFLFFKYSNNHTPKNTSSYFSFFFSSRSI